MRGPINVNIAEVIVGKYLEMGYGDITEGIVGRELYKLAGYDPD